MPRAMADAMSRARELAVTTLAWGLAALVLVVVWLGLALRIFAGPLRHKGLGELVAAPGKMTRKPQKHKRIVNPCYGPSICPTGCTGTTGIVLMPALDINHPSAGQVFP